eukprot:Nitzschia sp. Nitz4//scaffold149_size55946//45925//48045//NITZ4_006602-RA/size55946-processed-gene-0.33-mRNA-1//-1//CDS//3329536833//2079//frame0
MSTTTGDSVQEEDWVDLPQQTEATAPPEEPVDRTTTAKDASDIPAASSQQETTGTTSSTEGEADTPSSTMTPSATKPTKKNLQASYQEIQQAKQLEQQQEREQAEAQAEAERQAKEADRLASIQRLEVERQQKKKEQEQKAQEEAKAAAAAAAVPSSANSTSNSASTSTEAPAGVAHADASTTGTSAGASSTHTTSLLVLISTAFGTMEQRTNQDRAISMIQALQLPLETVDGSDPACKDRRNELFGISGLRGKYPQIFQQQDGALSFLGDYDGLQAMNESGALARMAPVSASSTSSATGSAPAPAVSNSTPSEGASSSTLASSMVVLVSKSFGTMEQRTQQDRAITMLQAKGIPYEEVDGSDPACKDRRNEMFGISGLRGKYPQIFTKNSDGTLSYFGDYEALQAMNESGDIANVVVVAPPEPAPPATESSAAATQDRVIVLVSKGFGSPEQRSQQDRAITMLRAKGIPFEEVDGSDPACKDRRNELFAISGMRGKYPQFFSPAGGTLTFLGMFEAIEAMNEQGNLQTDAVHTMPSAAATPAPAPAASSTSAMESVPEKEAATEAPPKPTTAVPGRSESYQVPNETFENEFEIPTRADGKPVRSESTQIPNETFENEFDAQSTDNDNLVPDDEKFENEFQPSGDECDDDEDAEPLLSRELEDMGAAAIPSGQKGGPANPAPVDMTLVLGILAVSVVVGIWLATRH